MVLILLVLDGGERLDQVLTAWEEAGVGGITILPSTGLGRVRRRQGLREDMPLFPALEDFYRPESDFHYTLFTLVQEDLVPRVVEVTYQVVGDLNQPGTGILAVLPVLQLYGLSHRV